MADESKDYLLKVVQAWIDLKSKIVNLVLIGNGVALTTSIAFLRDKGAEKFEGTFPLKSSALGILLGAVAMWVAY